MSERLRDLGKWSDEKIIQLIDLYEQKPLLWRKSSPDYGNQVKRKEAEDEIGSALGCSGTETKLRWTSLRQQYFRCLKQEMEFKSGLSAKPRAQWKYMNNLRFLNSELTETGSTSDDAKLFQNNAAYTESSSPTNTIPKIIFSNEIPSASVLQRKRKTIDDECTSMRSERHEIFKDIVEILKEKKDRNHSKFGAFVASTIESMQDPDLEKLTEIKIRIVLAEMCQQAAKRQLMLFEAHPESISSKSKSAA